MHFILHGMNLIYPRVCGICGRIDAKGLCKKCEIILNKQLELKIDSYKNNSKIYFGNHIYLGKYEGILRQKILDYKFGKKAYLHSFFSYLFLKEKKICVLFEKYDIILPVPIHKKRKAKRGYNQCELIAKEIVKQVKGLNLETTCFIKKQNVIPQSMLTRNQRIQNVHGVYEVIEKEKVKQKKILILDDVFTTGSTANECAKVLLQQGEANMVDILTIAKD